DLQGLEEKLKGKVTAYCGFDPTADSLHIGHLQQIMLLRRYQQSGHRPIALCGGATGMIGDPRPTTERKLITLDEVAHNVECIKKQLSNFIDFSDDKALLLNNHDWLGSLSLLDFLRDYGKHFNVSYMIAKDTISSRLSSGISFTEFTYTILQAADWLHLYKNFGCELQIGGSDQWGNLVSGSDLIRKICGDTAKVFGITSPLITKSDGSKFGKSEGGNIWLDASKTSAYEFYQFWVNIADSDVINSLKKLTLLSKEEIDALEVSLNQEPHLRKAQKALASELTILVHGQSVLDSALNITQTLFNGDITTLSLEELKQGLKDAKKAEIKEGSTLLETLVDTKICSSNREARELISGNSIQVNGTKITDPSFVLHKKDALHQELCILKKGKKHWFVCTF
ncbi:MAG: tyrosine--tRNA ligase, partial [Erysipelotrichaceae bacterium]